MKHAIILLLFALMTHTSSFGQAQQLDNVFYCFNNCFRSLPNAPEGFDEQAAMIKKLGYDGLAGHESIDYFGLRQALDKVGVEMPEYYAAISVNDIDEIVYNKSLKEILRDSKDRNLLLTLHLHSEKYMNNQKEGDKLFVKGIRELADYCAPLNIKIAIYPHVSFYCEELAHSVKLVKKIDRKNVGTVFNTCHLLKVEGEKGWKKKAKKALPYLFMVSLNGANSGDTQNMGWDQLIQPLGEGTFNTYELVKFLKDRGYEGAFGLQCYNIKQDCEFALSKSQNTWKIYKKMYWEVK